jgi:hypothetical protein
MTIRQYLKRRSDRYARLALVFLIGVGIAMGYVPRILAIRIVFAVLVAVIVIAAFWSLFEIPCPNCAKPMGRVGFWVGVGPQRKVTEHCPHCGISLDAEMPAQKPAPSGD